MSCVFNLVWVNPQPRHDRNVEVAFGGPNTIIVSRDAEAVILFPSLMTPFVHHEKSPDPWIEVLLVSDVTITAAHVNRQLKVYEGLAANKRFHEDWLFTGVGDNILVEPATKDGEILRTHQKFEGVLHKMFEDRLAKAGFDKFFRVRLHQRALESSTRASASLRDESGESSYAWRAEYHDRLVKAVLDERHVLSGYQKLPLDGNFSFKVDPKLGPQPWIDREDPIQSYHPVYLFNKTEPECLNFGHLTDIHLNYRLEILKNTPVRVIEGTTATGRSTPIRDSIQPTTRSFTQLLNQVAGDSDAHALAIGGDLIDHHLNAFTSAPVAPDMEAVWRAVDVTEDGQERAYAPGVDMVGFYSLLMRFCRDRTAKPVFGIAGNHDAYLEPFGISPRMAGVRANAGIAADVNLTLYEAVLAFGPSFADFTFQTDPSRNVSSFKWEWMEWFYTVFTPWGDASIQLPKQRVVCLGWGNDEDMVEGGQTEPGSIAHLPRADDAVSDVQLRLLQNAAGQHEKFRVVVISHFTVASFTERIPMRTPIDPKKRGGATKPTKGTLRTKGDEDFFNMGTFEQNHDKFLTLLKDRTITCILTGHSHRRGLYFMGNAQPDPERKGLKYPVEIHDPEVYFKETSRTEHKMPAIIVSDSGGPFPRYNWTGEFMGWGSDQPGGSIVRFAKDGSLEQVRVIRAGLNQPRLAVAVDYADCEKNIVWEKSIQTKAFNAGQELEMVANKLKGATSFYELDVPLHKEMLEIGLSVATISFFAAGMAKPALEVAVGGRRVCPLSIAQSQALYAWQRRAQAPDMFLAITFDWNGNEHVRKSYDEKSAWIFEVAPVRQPGRGTMRYEFQRPMRKAGLYSYSDLPDFKWRRDRAAAARSGT